MEEYRLVSKQHKIVMLLPRVYKVKRQKLFPPIEKFLGVEPKNVTVAPTDCTTSVWAGTGNWSWENVKLNFRGYTFQIQGLSARIEKRWGTFASSCRCRLDKPVTRAPSTRRNFSILSFGKVLPAYETLFTRNLNALRKESGAVCSRTTAVLVNVHSQRDSAIDW